MEPDRHSQQHDRQQLQRRPRRRNLSRRTVKVNIVNNTIARNDSTATGSDAFGGPCTETSPVSAFCPAAEAIGGLTTSDPQVAGISSFIHSDALRAALVASSTVYATQTFSNPVLRDDILWQNRSFYWSATANGGLGALLPRPGSGSPYWELAVYGFPGPAPTMSPTYSLLTDTVGSTPSATNLIGTAPLFAGGCVRGTGTGGQPTGPVSSGVGSCFNVNQGTQAGAGLGNFVTVTFTPTGFQGDYHLLDISPAIDKGTAAVEFAFQNTDYDRQSRPVAAAVDIGADETVGAAAGPVPPPWVEQDLGAVGQPGSASYLSGTFTVRVREQGSRGRRTSSTSCIRLHRGMGRSRRRCCRCKTRRRRRRRG